MCVTFSISRGEWVLIGAGAVITAPIWIPAGLVWLGKKGVSHFKRVGVPSLKRHAKRKHRSPLQVLKDAKKNHEEKRASKNIFHTRDPAYFFSRATEFEAESRFTEAIEMYTEVIKMNPRNAIALYGRGRIQYKAGYHDEGVADLAKCLELDLDAEENGVKAEVNGEIQTVHLHRADVFSVYGTALVTRNENRPPLLDGAEVDPTKVYRDDELLEAAAAFSEAIALDPDHDMALRQRGLIYCFSSNRELAAQAVKDLRRAIQVVESQNDVEGRNFEFQQRLETLHNWLNRALVHEALTNGSLASMLPWTPGSHCLYPRAVQDLATTVLALGGSNDGVPRHATSSLARLPEDLLCCVLEFAVDNVVSTLGALPDFPDVQLVMEQLRNRDFYTLYNFN